MIPSEIRKEARLALKEKWGKAVIITLAYSCIMLLLSFGMAAFKDNNYVYMLIYILEIVVSVPLAFGLTISFIKLKRGEEVSSFEFITDGFSRFTKSWGIWFHTFIRMLLPIICFVLVLLLMVLLTVFNFKSYALAIVGTILFIATIVYTVSRALLYFLAYYISYDNENLSSKDCVKKSEELMVGNRGNIFLLALSFIGWAILSIFTLCVGYFWLIPYIQIAYVCFYERVAKIEPKKVDGKVKIEEE